MNEAGPAGDQQSGDQQSGAQQSGDQQLRADSRYRDWPASVQLRAGPGGLPVVHVRADGGAGEIAMNGAHLLEWQPAGQRPVLWMSSASRFVAGAPIRGGVPICFPWFGMRQEQPDAPQHGFARILDWELVDAREAGDSVSVTFWLTDTDSTRASWWPHRFEAAYTVTIGRELRLSLAIWNRDDIPFSFEAALHNYYAVGDVRATEITGLEHLDFSGEKVADLQRETTPVRIRTGISRRYPNAATATIHDTENDRIITVTSVGSRGMVVWNPGADIAASMDDFADDQWPKMLCVETCNIDDGAVILAPGECFTMNVTIAVEPT